MKKYLTVNNILFFIGAVYLAITALPGIFNNLKQEGQKLQPLHYKVIESVSSDKKLIFPGERRSIAIFWASWCTPCKLEMNRLSSSVIAGKIPVGAIVAINPFEPPNTVRTFLKENSYPFTFIEDEGISRLLNISRTPTTLLLEENRVISLSSGLSYIGIWRAEQFLKID